MSEVTGINSGMNFSTVAQIIALLEPLNTHEKEHVLRTVITWLKLDGFQPTINQPSSQIVVSSLASAPVVAKVDEEKFSNRPVISVKDFIFEKDPKTDSERMACLAFYLTHYRDTPHFKTLDLSQLNTEAAHRRFSNAALSASNAMRDGFFVQAPKSGFKQISAMGERFVQLLPDREAAEEVKKRLATRRSRKVVGKSTQDADQGSVGGDKGMN